MANEKLPEVIEFKDLVKSIFVSLKAAEEALGLKAKTFSRLSIQRIPLYESQIEHYINNLIPVFTFSIKEYKDARSFVAYYGKDIKRWFKLKKEIYKDKQAEFAERLYNLDDDSFINELGDEYSETITSIRKEYHEYGTTLCSWIKNLTIHKLFNSDSDYFEPMVSQWDPHINKEYCSPSNINNILNFAFRAININVMLDCLNVSASLLNRSPHSWITSSWILIKRNRKNSFSKNESIGLWLPIMIWEKLQAKIGITFFVNKNTDIDIWETKCVCLTNAFQTDLSFVEIDSQNNLQLTSFGLIEGKYNLVMNSNKNFITKIFPEGFYLIPKEECTNSEYITNVIFKDINKDLYAKDETEKICAMINNLYLSNSFDIKNFVLSLLNKEVQPTNEL